MVPKMNDISVAPSTEFFEDCKEQYPSDDESPSSESDTSLRTLVSLMSSEATCIRDSDIGPFDVLCGRGGATNSNEGNVRFRQLIHEHKGIYGKTQLGGKYLIAQKLVDDWERRGGRFLERCRDKEGMWMPLDKKRAYKKAFQCLRSKTPHILPTKTSVRLHIVIPRKPTDVQSPLDLVQGIHDNDVVFNHPRHPGTIWFRRLIRCNRPLYSVSKRDGKHDICKAIVDAVATQSPQGRFIEEKSGKLAVMVSSDRVMLKVSLAFRESIREPSLKRMTSRDLEAAEALLVQCKAPTYHAVITPEAPIRRCISVSESMDCLVPSSHIPGHSNGDAFFFSS